MGRSVRTLLFDFGGTLDADGVAWKERFLSHYREEGLGLTEQAFAACFYAADDQLVGALPPDTALEETVRRLAVNLEAILPSDNSQGGRGERVAEAFLEHSHAALARNRNVLEALSQRYKLGIVSNFYGNLPGVCRGAGIDSLFGAIIDSELVGARKPDAAIFHAALEPLDADPQTTVMVGDSLHRDRAGARGLGMGFVWISAPDAQDTEAEDVGAPGHSTINRFPDLADLLL